LRFSIPKIAIPDEELEKFEIFWKMFAIEMESKDDLQNDIPMMLKRLLILCKFCVQRANGVDYI
jgi:hypothetical protein